MTAVDRAAGAEPGDSERERDRLKARAWRMSNHEQKSVREVAEELGLSVATAHRWIKQGQAAEVYADLLERQRRRLDMADRFRLYRQMLGEEYRAGGSAGGGKQRAGAGSFRELVPALMQIELAEMKLLRLEMPVEVEHSWRDQHGEAPPAGIVEAILEARAVDEARRQAIERGELYDGP